MDTATLTAALLATFLLMATMMVQPAAAEHNHESSEVADTSADTVVPEQHSYQTSPPPAPGNPMPHEPRRRGVSSLASPASFEDPVEGYGAPATLATPDGGPGQFEHEETVDLSQSDELMGGIPREFNTNNKTVGPELDATATDTSDIVMSGGGPGDGSTPYQFQPGVVDE